MTATHMQGPLVTTSQDGPDLSWGGNGLLDPRQGYQNGQDYTVPILGWTGNDMFVLDAAPAASGAATIAPAQVVTVGNPIPLVTTTSAAVTVGASVTNLATGQLATNLIAIDGPSAVIKTTPLTPLQIYDPRRAVSRAVTITSVGNDSTATFTVRGYDLYGQPMSEVITGANAGIATGKKAFKYIASVTPSGTLSGSNVSVGTSDIIGLPYFAAGWEYMTVYYGNPTASPPTNVQVTTAAGFTAGVTTLPATGTTGDVRGTYQLQTASNGTNKLTMIITIPPWASGLDANGIYSGIFGVANFAN